LALSTPRDLEAAAADPDAIQFSAEPPLDFNQVQSIAFKELLTLWLGSRPDAMECYRVGTLENAVPPPPDWQRASNQIPPWTQAVATSDTAGLPYLNQAIFCWPPEPAGPDAAAPGVYLLRQNIQVDDQLPIVRATLRIATNAHLLEAALGEQPLHLGEQPRRFRLVEFDVTPFLAPGANILAIRAAEEAGKPDRSYGLAFSLEIVRRHQEQAVPEADPAAALLQSASGDRVRGRLRSLNGDQLVLATPYGDLQCPWPSCAALLLPRGYAAAAAKGGWFDRPALPPADPQAAAAVMPLGLWPAPGGDRIALTAQRLTTARATYLSGPQLHVEANEGGRFDIPITDVRGIYPAPQDDAPLLRPDSITARLLCRVQLNTGERLTGLLRELTGKRLVLEPLSSTPLTLKTEWLAGLSFPLHGVVLKNQLGREQQIGLLPLLPGQDRVRKLYTEFERQAQAACLAIGATPATVPIETLANPEQLTPRRYPVLICVDPLGEYLATYSAENDAQQALLQYLEQGGKVLALSRGGVFRTAVRRSPAGQFARTLAQPGLLGPLGFTFLRNSDPAHPEAQPFEHPDNRIEQLYFQRGEGLAGPLLALPRRVPLGPLYSPTFFPLLPPANATIAYSLISSSNTTYGPALSITPHGRGQLIIIDHLLWNSLFEDAPVAPRLLPALLASLLQ
jgi:hypothetical protein